MNIISKRGRESQTSATVTATPGLDAVSFINTHLKLADPHYGSFKLLLNPPQERYVRALSSEDSVISKQPRRAGQTTSSLAFCFYRACQTASTTLVVMPNSRMANYASDRLRALAVGAPHLNGIQLVRQSWSASAHGVLQFANGSTIHVIPGQTKLPGVSKMDTIYLGDFAHMLPVEQDTVLMEAMMLLKKNSKLIVASTPRHANDKFHELWLNAVRGAARFTPVEVAWHEYMTNATYLQHARLLPNDVLRREIDCEFF